MVERVNYSPRVGMSVSVLPEGRAHPPWRIRQVRRADAAHRRRLHAVPDADRQPVRCRRHADRRPGHVRPRPRRALKTPESIVQTVAWDQRFGRRFFFKTAYLHRNGSSGYILYPDVTRGLLTLSSTGESKYWEVETTGRYPRGRAPRPHRLVRAVAQHPGSQRLRSVLRQLQEPDHPSQRERRSARPTSRTA